MVGAVDLVTETDKHCEEIILSAIQNAFPDHKFIGEEGSAAQVEHLHPSVEYCCGPRGCEELCETRACYLAIKNVGSVLLCRDLRQN